MKCEIGLDRSEEEVSVPAGECWLGPGHPGAVSQTRTLGSVCVHFGNGTPGCVVRVGMCCVCVCVANQARTERAVGRTKSNQMDQTGGWCEPNPSR